MAKTVQIRCPHCGHSFYAKAKPGLGERVGKTWGGAGVGFLVAGPLGSAIGGTIGLLSWDGSPVDCPKCGKKVERADIK